MWQVEADKRRGKRASLPVILEERPRATWRTPKHCSTTYVRSRPEDLQQEILVATDPERGDTKTTTLIRSACLFRVGRGDLYPTA